MDKREFLKRLERSLKRLVPEERARYISYYDEIIMDLVDGGMSEQDAVAKQGDVSVIVTDIMSQVEPEKVVKKNVFEITLLAIGCLIAVICIVVLIALPDVITFAMMDVDGPTSVFVAGKVNEPFWLYIITAVILLAGIVIFSIRKKGKLAVVLGVALLICGITFVVVRIDDSKNVEENVTTETADVYATPEVEEKTRLVIELVSDNDFTTIREEYAVDELKEILEDDYMLQIKAMINDDWGELESIGAFYSAEVSQNNINYIVVQVNATYENVSVAYTITFTEELMLAGIYMR
ncbi:MAG: DUF3887 domain-containing protein [Lachnospiraceae bacterium]|nr:DUF3887 domain-containing protein [Lachnospiraceae bacterium]